MVRAWLLWGSIGSDPLRVAIRPQTGVFWWKPWHVVSVLNPRRILSLSTDNETCPSWKRMYIMGSPFPPQEIWQKDTRHFLFCCLLQIFWFLFMIEKNYIILFFQQMRVTFLPFPPMTLLTTAQQTKGGKDPHATRQAWIETCHSSIPRMWLRKPTDLQEANACVYI